MIQARDKVKSLDLGKRSVGNETKRLETQRKIGKSLKHRFTYIYNQLSEHTETFI